MSGNEIADSTDWLSTPLSVLTPLESALRCQICKDFYETPMITTCSHTFCSLCIRRALSAEGKCPACRNNEQELRLRSNWSMEEAVEAFKTARTAVLALARRPEPAERSPKRKADDIEEYEQKPTETKRLRSSARLSQNRSQTTPSYAPEEVEEEEVIPVSDHEDEYVPEPTDGLVPCPSCQKRMKEWQVFAHLENCPGPEPVSKSEPSQTTAISQISTPRQHQKTLDRLPALNYGMYKDNALRKKLQELGLSSYGSRILMEKRHKEWITLWNANCDAAKPKKRHELLSDLEMWERTQGGRANTTGRAAQHAALIKDKDFDGAAWAAKHDNSFKDLIANARKSVQAKRQTTQEKSQNELETTDTAMDDANVTINDGPPAPVLIPAEDVESAPSLPNGTYHEPHPDQILGDESLGPQHDQNHDTITYTGEGGPQVFTGFQIARVLNEMDPTREQIHRWCELQNDPLRRPDAHLDDHDYKVYSAIVHYLKAEGTPVSRHWTDMSLEEDLDKKHRREEALARMASHPESSFHLAKPSELYPHQR